MAGLTIRGKVHKFGDDVNTDEIIPARYLTTFDREVLGRYCLSGIDAEFPRKVRPGDIVVAGKNFGCGSSREHAPLALLGAGVAAVVARSFARIFFRNAFNIGLPILECKEVERIQAGDELELDVSCGRIRNLSSGEEYTTQAFPEFMQRLIRAGGLLNYVLGK